MLVMTLNCLKVSVTARPVSQDVKKVDELTATGFPGATHKAKWPAVLFAAVSLFLKITVVNTEPVAHSQLGGLLEAAGFFVLPLILVAF